jgi:hypothetical protein
MIIGNQNLVNRENSGNAAFSDANIQMEEEESIGPLTDSVDDMRMRIKAGEWKVVLQLIAVLQHGKLAKKLTDKAIDMCDHMQNLRIAVTDYKLRIDALEIGSKRYKMMYELGCNYLVRYFYLIAFADYLLEVWIHSTRKGVACSETSPEDSSRQLFSDWLKDRREIINIIRNQSLE